MASLTLTLTEAEVAAILDHGVVRAVCFEDEPEYDEARHRVACRISDYGADVPIPVALDEAQALLDAICESGYRELPPGVRATLGGIVGALDFIDEGARHGAVRAAR